jgi:hypothetical protein
MLLQPALQYGAHSEHHRLHTSRFMDRHACLPLEGGGGQNFWISKITQGRDTMYHEHTNQRVLKSWEYALSVFLFTCLLLEKFEISAGISKFTVSKEFHKS